MIHASEAREIVDNALTGLYEEVVDSIHQGIISKSEDGYTMMTCNITPNVLDVFERYEDDLMRLLKESGYHVSKPDRSHAVIHFMISWKEDNPFLEDQLERPEWWQFWK